MEPELRLAFPWTSTIDGAPRLGGRSFDASNKESFELVHYSVDGETRTIRRTARKSGQSYSVNISHESVAAQQPVKISYTYKTIVAQDGHLLHFDIDQPTKG